jgi:hypothetical protein
MLRYERLGFVAQIRTQERQEVKKPATRRGSEGISSATNTQAHHYRPAGWSSPPARTPLPGRRHHPGAPSISPSASTPPPSQGLEKGACPSATECEARSHDVVGTLETFAELIRTGEVWTLEGTYGRAATALIEGGYIAHPRNSRKGS